MNALKECAGALRHAGGTETSRDLTPTRETEDVSSRNLLFTSYKLTYVYRLITIAINAPLNGNKAYVYPYVTSQEGRTTWQLHGICRVLSSASIVDVEWIVKLTYMVCAGIRQWTSTLDHPQGHFELMFYHSSLYLMREKSRLRKLVLNALVSLEVTTVIEMFFPQALDNRLAS